MIRTIVYGWNRLERDFPKHELLGEVVWLLDNDKIGRHWRQGFIDFHLRDPETDRLLLLSWGDLGRGGELPGFKALIAATRVPVVIAEPVKQPPKKNGPAPKFDNGSPTGKIICDMWLDPVRHSTRSVLQYAETETSQKVTRNSLNRGCGTRWSKLNPKGKQNA
jgi:hypothetical protein